MPTRIDPAGESNQVLDGSDSEDEGSEEDDEDDEEEEGLTLEESPARDREARLSYGEEAD
eukprot:12120208-Karenia_brevis.AAC.1